MMLAAGAVAQTPRYPELNPATLNAAQKTMYDAPDGRPAAFHRGAVQCLAAQPGVGQSPAAGWGIPALDATVPHNLNEFAILITATEWKCGFEWYAHYPLAIKAGLEPAVAKDLQEGRRPANMSMDETLVYDFATQLQRQKQVSDTVYHAAVARFGEQGVTDLIGLIGYYNIVSMTLNVAEVHPPADAGPTLPPPAPVTQ